MNIILRKTRSAFWRMLGIDKINQELREEKAKTARLREEVDTLQYFLNTLHDCSALPPTDDPDLRIMQECDAIMLQIFDKVCRKHNLVYWLDYGTLLGAVRHKGFIPWDDDMDLCMTRESYERFRTIWKMEMEGTDFQLDEHLWEMDNPDPLSCKAYGLGYRHLETGIWLDILPMDELMADEVDLQSRFRAIAGYSRQGNWDKIYTEGNATNRYTYCPVESYRVLPWNNKDLFPLAECEFEGSLFYVPGDYAAHIETLYHNYTHFPKTGAEHHDLGRGPLKTWAKKHGVDMRVIKKELLAILDAYK